MSENLCVRCARPTPDGYACPSCASRAAENLREVAEYTPAARDIAQGLSSRSSGGGASGKPGSRLPLDLAATARLDAIGNALGGWVRVIGEERGVYPERLPAGFDTIAPAARFLAEHLEWMRHRPECDEFLTDVDACARVIRGLVRGPGERKYLGPCGAAREHEELCGGGAVFCDPDCICWCHLSEPANCEGDVYGYVGAATGRCKTCGAEVDQGERRIWLDEQVADKAFRASVIADAYGINVNTIRTWARPREELKAPNGVVIRPERPAKLREHSRDRLNRPQYLVGDVLQLARDAADRREQRRAAQAADERMSA